MTDLQRGWAVVGNDGGRIGTVHDVGQNYVVAGRTGLPHDLYVPASAIANVDGEVVYLNVTRRTAGEMGWEQPPRGGDALEGDADADLHRHI